MGPRSLFWVALVAVGAVVGCGGSDGHPDTGYGANQPVPTTETCVDLCQRLGDCVVDLCDEDSSSTRYVGTQSLLAYSCLNRVAPTARFSRPSRPRSRQCSFEDTCRQVFGEDTCHAMSHYTCS